MKYIKFYPECVIITAVVLYIKHLLYPYDFREKFPYDDPPPKFFGSFSLGELVQYNPGINVTYYRICYDSFAIFREGSGCNTDDFISYVVVHTNRTR